jgi:peptidoglycan/LPS O-acetylase OafA/YrhL
MALSAQWVTRALSIPGPGGTISDATSPRPKEASRRAASERLPELDALRGAAAFAVLLFHALHVIGKGHLPPWLQAGRAIYVVTVHSPLRPVFFGREAVLFFFVLSGYVLTRSLLRSGSPGLVAFAAQRTLRLGLPVAAAVLVSAGMYWLLLDPATEPFLWDYSLGMWAEPLSVGQIAANIGLIGADADFPLDVVLWSLVHEWRLTVFLPVVLMFCGHAWALLTAGLVLTALGLAGHATENAVLLGPHLRSSVAATLYFSTAVASGASLALFELPPLLAREHRLAAGIAAMALLSMQSDFAVYGGSALLIMLARGPGTFPALLRSAPVVWLGRVSFSLYLVHMPVMVVVLSVLQGHAPVWMIALAGAAAALPAASLLRRFAEIPSRRLARWVEVVLSRSLRQPWGLRAR